MADSEDEFMPISVAASAAFVAKKKKKNICRPGVGRASAGRQYQTYLIPPANVVRASARRTTPGRCDDFWNSHNRCPADAPRRPTMTSREFSEFPPLGLSKTILWSDNLSSEIATGGGVYLLHIRPYLV